MSRKISMSLIGTVGELVKSQSSTCEEEGDRSTKQVGGGMKKCVCVCR